RPLGRRARSPADTGQTPLETPLASAAATGCALRPAEPLPRLTAPPYRERAMRVPAAQPEADVQGVAETDQRRRGAADSARHEQAAGTRSPPKRPRRTRWRRRSFVSSQPIIEPAESRT